ncbi:hypothetical protein B7463_g10132, partial [Scytalidium lignicola]
MAGVAHGFVDGSTSSGTKFTLTALNRWSVANKQLPAVNNIKAIHVYDFDNTLFNSPLPNPKLWNGQTIGFLQGQDIFVNGGWWHDSRILAATGEGAEVEEPKGWKGWWNEKIVQLIELSMQQKDALTVLLTGRAEGPFSSLIKKMVASRALDFDMIALKPAVGPNSERFSSTMAFKQVFLGCLMETYKEAEEIRVYEDRVKHVKGFRDFFTEYNRKQNGIGGIPTRGPITAEVVQVADSATLLDPIVEVAEVQRLINDHNTQVSKGGRGQRFRIKKTVFYTGYLIGNDDTQKLLTLAQLPKNMPDSEMKFLANNVLITPRPCPKSILDKVGGMGSKTTWEVTGTAIFENKIWAASVKPVPETKKYYTENPVPIVVLALRKGAKPIDAGKIQNWQPVPAERAFIFETIVGEKVQLRIEEEDLQENEYESLFPNKSYKRKHAQEEVLHMQRQPSGSHGQGQPQNGRGGFQQNYPGRGGRGNNRGNGSQRNYRETRSSTRGGGRARGRGGHNYRSLDDVADKSNRNITMAYDVGVSYEDFPPLQKQSLTPQQLVQQQFENYQAFQQQQQQQTTGQSNQRGKENQSNGELQYV